jgi:putrescine aminotransferase
VGSASAQVFDGYCERSWRFLAQLQRSRDMEFVIGKAEGCYLWNLEGSHRLLDCGNSGGVHSLGHRNPELLATIRAALDQYDAGIWTMPSAEGLALQDALAAFAPVPSICRSVVTLSSTDSIDLAVMFAFRFTGRRKILAYRYGYHGHGGYAALVTGSDAEGVLDHYSLPRTQSSFFGDYGAIAAIERELNEDCAAVILEPMNYETFQPAPADFLPSLAALCRKNGTLLIIDETRTGLGRSGRPWMSSGYDLAPDMLILGKGLGGGLYPVSAVLTTAPIYERCMNDGHWGFMSSMAGSAIGSLVASKVVEIIQRPSLLANVARLEQAMSEQCQALCRQHPSVFALAWVLGGIGAIGVRGAAAATVQSEMFRRGILCHSVSEIEPRVLKFFPCLTSDPAIAGEIAAALDDFASAAMPTRACSGGPA